MSLKGLVFKAHRLVYHSTHTSPPGNSGRAAEAGGAREPEEHQLPPERARGETERVLF